MPGSLTLMGMSAGLPGGQVVDGPVTMTGSNLVGGVLDPSLVSGDNTFAIPSGAVMVSIYPGTATAVTLKIRTDVNESDGGWHFAPYPGVSFFASPLDPNATELIINSSGSYAGLEIRFK